MGKDLKKLRNERRELLRNAQKIMERAEKRGGRLKGTEDRELSEIIEDIDSIDFELRSERLGDFHEERIAKVGGGVYGDRGYRPHGDDAELDADGILPQEASFRSYVKRNRNRFRMADEEFDDLTLGQYVRALVTGPKTDVERRALAEGTDSAGGHLVPTILSARVIDALRARTVVFRSGAQTVPLETDETVVARVATDPVAAWRAENAAVAESDPTFEGVTFSPKSLAVIFKASRELVEDAPNFERTVERMITESFARKLDAAALVGVGSTGNEPLGLSNSTSVNSVSLGANGARPTDWTPFLDGIKELQVDDVDTPVDRLTAVMHPRTFNTFAALASTGDGQPLQRPPFIDGLGMDVTTSVPINQTQGTSTDASSIFLGDYRSMMVGVRSDVRIITLQERFADNYQIGFLAAARWDIQHEHPESFANIVGVTT